jgi:uncharacterized membrane protein
MKFTRAIKHIFHNPWIVQRCFPKESMKRIEQAIKASEHLHSGQVVVAIEPALEFGHVLRVISPRRRAIDVFSRLRIWDTEQNNGVLIYLLLADRDVEILADRGIHQAAGQDAWDSICSEMEQSFRRGEFEAGVIKGIERVTAILKDKFPPNSSQKNELPNKLVVL